MSDFDDVDEESLRENLIELVIEAKSGEQEDLKNLESYLTYIKNYIKHLGELGQYTEVLLDLDEDFADILNDAKFRQNSVGPSATQCEDLFRLIYNYIAVENVNTQVILACNPFVPMDILEELILSEEYWEEDGTQQALARNTKDSWVLEKLSKSTQEVTRYEVAFNTSAPPEILEALVGDTGQCNWQVEEIKFGEVSKYRSFIRWAVIQNPNAPEMALQKVIDGTVPSLNLDADVALQKFATQFLEKKL